MYLIDNNQRIPLPRMIPANTPTVIHRAEEIVVTTTRRILLGQVASATLGAMIVAALMVTVVYLIPDRGALIPETESAPLPEGEVTRAPGPEMGPPIPLLRCKGHLPRGTRTIPRRAE